jgi:hypothetical protein
MYYQCKNRNTHCTLPPQIDESDILMYVYMAYVDSICPMINI